MTKLYRANTPIDYNHERYEIDEMLDLPDQVAAGLGDAVTLTDETPVTEITEAMIVAAIDGLDPSHTDNFTKAGAPQVAALEDVLGGDITSAQRDAAWDTWQQARDAE